MPKSTLILKPGPNLVEGTVYMPPGASVITDGVTPREYAGHVGTLPAFIIDGGYPKRIVVIEGNAITADTIRNEQAQMVAEEAAAPRLSAYEEAVAWVNSDADEYVMIKAPHLRALLRELVNKNR